MAGTKSNYLENAIINAVLRNTTYTSPATVYVALATAYSGDGTTFTEVTGGSYARVAVTFSAPSDGATSNSGVLTFPTATADWGTCVAFAVFDEITSGNQLYHGDLTVNKTVLSGDTATFGAGELDITEA